MEQPRGFVDSSNPTFVCRLHKALYGLKQAPRAWYTRLSQSLLDLGFTSSLVDTSLFTYHHKSVHIFVLIYVDDIIVTGTNFIAISDMISNLQQDFALKDLGPLSYFLGIQATRNSKGIHLYQSKYIMDLLHKSKIYLD